METSYFKLSFDTNLGKTATVNIPNPDPSVAPNVVRDAMDKIIALNIIDFKNGRPMDRKSAVIVTRKETEITLP